jgi:HlyD family secretion protein
MKKAISIVVVVLALAAVGSHLARRFLPSPNGGDGPVRVSGNIEVTDAELSFKIPGRVVRREIDEGQVIQAGQVIARLETAELEQEVAVRRAEVRTAAAIVAELEAGTRPEEVAQAAASLDYARAEARRAELDFERQTVLRNQSVATDREYELAEAARRTSQARVREVEERLSLLRKGPRAEQIEQGRARLEQARQSLTLAETRLGYATLTAPFSGLVLAKQIEPGEYVSPGTPVVTVGDLERPWLRAYINETDLGRVRVGQRVFVTTDTYPDRRYEGRVSFLSSQAEFTPKNVQTRQERVKLVYRIKVDLANPNQELKPGMPADADIDVTRPVETRPQPLSPG